MNDRRCTPIPPPSRDRALALTLAALAAIANPGCPSDQDGNSGETSGGEGGSSGAGSDAGANENSGAGGDAGANQSPGDELHGWFTAKIVPPMAATPVREATDGRATVTGKLGDAETPQATIWSVSAEEGDCALLTPRVPFCDPDCGGTALCVADGVCQPYPTAQGVGMVRVVGLGEEFSMRPIAGNYQPPAGTALPYPPCEEGTDIRFEAEGDAYPPFALAARCIAPIDVPGGSLQIEPGEPLALSWTAAGQPEIARVHVDLDVSHHGGSRGKIECDVEDTGAAAIPAGLLQELLDLGVAGFPTVILTRTLASQGSTEQSRLVTLTVSSSFETQVEIPGLMSCTTDGHCPSGQTCQIDLTCQ